MESKASMERESSEESDESDTTKESTCTRGSGAEMKSYPASVKKLDKLSDRTESCSSEDDFKAPEGFRLVDISVLGSIFQLFRCPVCRYSNIDFEDDCAKMGFASLLLLRCTNQKCKFSERFYTSLKVTGSQCFEVNRRMVLATRKIGIGHLAPVKFTCVLNMPCPMNENSFRDHLAAVKNAAETVAK